MTKRRVLVGHIDSGKTALAAALSYLLERHNYMPSTMHMGDCAICGQRQNAPIHRADGVSANPKEGGK